MRKPGISGASLASRASPTLLLQPARGEARLRGQLVTITRAATTVRFAASSVLRGRRRVRRCVSRMLAFPERTNKASPPQARHYRRGRNAQGRNIGSRLWFLAEALLCRFWLLYGSGAEPRVLSV